jgi:aldehyde dehydrogenase (NAD+)
VDHLETLFQRQRAARWQVAAGTPAERGLKLQRLLDALLARREEAHAALAADFRKVPAEVDLAELYPLAAELRHAIRRLERWMRPVRVGAPLGFAGSRAWIRHEPKGVVLVISPWNYPLYLGLGPLISAVAAGNCVVLKPSEFTPHASDFLRSLLDGLFPEAEVAVAEGGQEVAEALLRLPFDHVFFTGSPEVGRTVMAAAAGHLASVTLELGGKSPVLVEADADLRLAARRIVWGKFLNAGQTCVAPDHVLAHARIHDALVEELGRAVARFYGATPAERRRNPDYARILNARHHARLRRLLADSGGRVAVGGDWDEADRYFAPTVVTGVAEDAPLMREEIFGPILPVLPVPDLEAAVAMLGARPKPLALYVFTARRARAEALLARTTAGGSCVNDTVLQFVHPGLPGGGVNASGFGKAHGRHGFQAFSNARGILRSPRWYSPAQWLYPPYTPWVRRLIHLVVRHL